MLFDLASTSLRVRALRPAHLCLLKSVLGFVLSLPGLWAPGQGGPGYRLLPCSLELTRVCHADAA